jgi:hypothetical protein
LNYDFTDSIDVEVVIGSQKWYRIRSIGMSSYYTNKNDGLYISLDSGNTSKILYKYPASLDETIISQSDTTKVISLHTLVETQAGKYDCIVYKKRQLQNSFWIYDNISISNGVGKIQTEFLASLDQKKFYKIGLIELKEYRINLFGHNQSPALKSGRAPVR